MEKTFDAVVIIGTLRRDSFTRRLVQAMIPLAPVSLNLGIVEIRDLSLYNQDDDASPPAPWTSCSWTV